MKWTKRKPMTHYYRNGHISFSVSRKDKELWYSWKQWDEEGITLYTLERGKVKDEAHLKNLLSAIPIRNEVLQ